MAVDFEFAAAGAGGGGIAPPNAMTGSGTSSSASTASMKEVGHVRSVFPETWLWTNSSVGYNSSIILAPIIILDPGMKPHVVHAVPLAMAPHFHLCSQTFLD